MILNYTTKVPPEKTISEMQQMLVKYGISGMMTEYDGRNVSSVSFKIELNGTTMGFRMPCNWRAVYEILKGAEYPKAYRHNEEQAIRVAWRILHTWAKAQLALVEVNMVTIPQVFLPYTIMRDGKTLAETISDNPKFLLS